jgi:hypothetical protein
LLRHDGAAAANVTAENVDAYLAEIRAEWPNDRPRLSASYGALRNTSPRNATSVGSWRSAKISHSSQSRVRNSIA